MYSPGSLKVAVTVPLPEYGWPTWPPVSVSSLGRPFSGAKVTFPGPRYLDHIAVTGGRGLRIGAFVPLVYLASSFAQSGSSMGVLAVAVRCGAFETAAIGPWIAGPFCSNFNDGGVLPTAASSKGLTL